MSTASQSKPTHSRAERLMRAILVLCVVGVVAVTVSDAAWAIDPEEPFEDPVLETRYRTLTDELRCLVCQNQTIADSDADLAKDLRRQVRRMMSEGATDAEILDYMVARYGDFVRYRPPLTPRTWLLWSAPVLMLAIGLVVAVTIVRRRSKMDLDLDETGDQPT